MEKALKEVAKLLPDSIGAAVLEFSVGSVVIGVLGSAVESVVETIFEDRAIRREVRRTIKSIRKWFD